MKKLKSIRVFTVDSIESTFTLDNFTHTDQEDLILEESPQDISVFIGQNYFAKSATYDVPICAKLADMLDLDLNLLFTLVSSTPELIELLLKVQNIPEIPAGHRDSSWLRDSDPSEIHTRCNYVPSERSYGQSASMYDTDAQPEKETYLKEELDLVLETASCYSLNAVSVLVAGAEGIEVSTRHFSLHSEKDISTYVERVSLHGTNAIAMVLDVGTGYDRGSSSTTTATAYQLGNGILGEFFVSAAFSSSLMEEILTRPFKGILFFEQAAPRIWSR